MEWSSTWLEFQRKLGGVFYPTDASLSHFLLPPLLLALVTPRPRLVAAGHQTKRMVLLRALSLDELFILAVTLTA
jgi:hypothetical protein